LVDLPQIMTLERQQLIFPAGVCYTVVGLVLLAMVDVDANGGPPEELAIGYVLGTIYGQSLVAAAWIALGPGRLWARSLASLGWFLLQIVAVAIQTATHRGPEEVLELLATSACVLWIVAQVPLWTFAWWFGCFLRPMQETSLATDSLRDHQFGIRQLMIVTAVVSVMLGVGRVAILNDWFQLESNHETATFAFLLVAAAVMMLPLIIAAFLRQHAWLAVLLVLVLIVGLTAAELPLHDSLVSRPGPNAWHLIWINAFTTFWVLLYVGTARLCGWRFGSRTLAASATGLAAAPPA
jgi:hypothetical protein